MAYINSKIPESTEIVASNNPISKYVEQKMLQNGKFGRVYIARNVENSLSVVMKVLQKKNDNDGPVVETLNLLQESSLLSVLSHPFVVRFEFSYETSTAIGLGIEYCSKGDIFTYLANGGRFNQDSARFYICQLVLGVEYLHQKGIIHRDIKPENLLLDSEGNLKICDFGLAKRGGISATSGAFTNCGTVTFMAPEMFRKNGYGFCADWWLVGMTAFEMLVGKPAHKKIDNKRMTNLHYSYILSIDFLHPEALAFLSDILECNPRTRLGRKGAKQVKSHEYFEDINWIDVAEKNFISPRSPHHGFEY